jgi:hypothetical protein
MSYMFHEFDPYFFIEKKSRDNKQRNLKLFSYFLFIEFREMKRKLLFDFEISQNSCLKENYGADFFDGLQLFLRLSDFECFGFFWIPWEFIYSPPY